MAEAPRILLEHHLKRLKLPTFLREYEKLARQCAAEGLDHVQFLARLVELELIDRERRLVERTQVHAATPYPYAALPPVPAILCPISRQGAAGPPLRKAESRRAMADVLGRGVRSRSEERRVGSTARPTPRAWRKGQDMTAPIRTPCRVRGECSIEGCERPRHARGWCSHHWRRWHRHGDPLASRCPRYTVDELCRLNAYLPRWRADQARGC